MGGTTMTPRKPDLKALCERVLEYANDAPTLDGQTLSMAALRAAKGDS